MIPFPFDRPGVTRSMNVEHFNRVANHESVRPHLGGDGVLQLRPVIENVRNYAFETAHGGFILLDCGAGRYDVHSLFLPDGRGSEAMQAMYEVEAYMFTRTDCTEGRTTVPEGNPGAMVLAKRAGFEWRFELEQMPWRTDTTTKAAFLSLTLEKWALTSTYPAHAGRWFHQQLDAAKRASGSALDTHPDEPVHDRMAGAVVLMVRGGQPDKAVAFYNAWALTSRYATIGLISGARRYGGPVVLDIGDAIIEASTEGMEILRCR